MHAIVFDNVSKRFRVGRPRHVKDALLGSSGRRHESRIVHSLREVSFAIPAGESVAILGHNGAGKSTTLKLLARTLNPSSGAVMTKGRIAPLLELGSGFHPDLTGRENIYLNAAVLGVSRRYTRAHLDEIIDFSGVEDQIDTPVRFYSTGMVARLGFSIAVHVDPEIILIDEVLAVGDADFQVKCLTAMRKMSQGGRTVVLVTHSLADAQSFCQRAIVLSHGQITFDGRAEAADGAFASSTRQRSESGPL